MKKQGIVSNTSIFQCESINFKGLDYLEEQ